METIIEVINGCGFPIATCIALFYYICKIQTPLINSITENTNAILTLVDSLKKEGSEENE